MKLSYPASVISALAILLSCFAGGGCADNDRPNVVTSKLTKDSVLPDGTEVAAATVNVGGFWNSQHKLTIVYDRQPGQQFFEKTADLGSASKGGFELLINPLASVGSAAIVGHSFPKNKANTVSVGSNNGTNNGVNNAAAAASSSSSAAAAAPDTP